MNLFYKIAFNTFAQAGAKVATVSFTLLTTILLTGYLGIDGFGNYIYVLTLAILVGSLADWGTLTIGVREISKEKDNQEKIIGNLFVLRIVFSLLAGLLIVLLSYLIPLNVSDPSLLRRMIRLSSLIVFLVAIKGSFQVVFQSRMQMHKAAIADISASGLIFLFSWQVVQNKLGLEMMIWSVILASFFASLIAWLVVRKEMKIDLNPDFKLIKKIIIESLPMGAILLMFTMDNKIDTIMLGSIKGSGSVGIYSLAYRIYDVAILGAAYYMNSLLPIISRCSDLDKWKAKLRGFFKSSVLVLFLLGFLVMNLTRYFSPLMIHVLTNRRYFEFADSVRVLRILSLSVFIAYFNHLTGYTIVALGKQRPYLRIALASLSFNIIANLIFIPRFSYWGAAWVTVLTEGLVLVFTGLFLYRLLK